MGNGMRCCIVGLEMDGNRNDSTRMEGDGNNKSHSHTPRL